MKICLIKDITGGEILAKPIYTDDYIELLAQGVVLKKEYIPRLQELGIKEVYIEEKESEQEAEGKLSQILIEEIREDIINKVKGILEKHTYRQSENLVKLSAVADDIIYNILNEKNVVEKIYDIKERSADIYEHSITVCFFSTLLALKLKYQQSKIYDIAMAGLVHDLGLRYLPFDYQNKNLTDMSDFELAEYRKHSIYGYSALEKADWISETSKNIILRHHEAIDGSGFPLHTETISKECSIVIICDVFDEMVCGIGYKRAKVYEAVEYLKLFAGSKLDAEIVKLFLEFIAVYPIGTKVITNEGETAYIIRQNKSFPERPVLKIIKDKKGKDVTDKVIKDLMKNYKIFIEQVLN